MEERAVSLALSLIRRRKRLEIGQKRIKNILGSYAVANARTLENKISDAGDVLDTHHHPGRPA